MTASQMAQQLRMLKGNVAEREVVLDILGVCGVLRTPAHGGYATDFVASVDRVIPPQRYVERSYPVCWWRGRDGLTDAALRQFLPQLIP